MSRMNELQENLFQLLTEFDEICKKYDIKYLLGGGSALGAVRNHRFLPWDDDIDLYLTRNNWNKLRNIIETQDILPKERSLIYKENTQYYCNPIPRYVDDTKSGFYRSFALHGEACGPHIELFIMDPLPNNEEDREEYIKLFRVYAELLTPYFIVNINLSPEEWEEHYKLFKKYEERVKKEGADKVIEELKTKLENLSIDEEECENYLLRWGKLTSLYKKENNGKSRPELFESQEFPVGEKAECIFRIQYGDSWMYIPEYEEQVFHNSVKSSIPHREYTSRYLNKINKDTAFNKYRNNNLNNISVYQKREEYNKLITRIKSMLEINKIEEELNGKEEYLESLLKNKEYTQLSAELEDYTKLQLNGDVRKYNIIIPISNKNLKTVLLNYIEQGKYFDANKIIKIYKANNKELNDEIKNIEDKINICRELSIARYDEKDEELVQSLIEKYEDKYPNLIDIHRCKIWIKENNAQTEEDYKEINELCEEALTLYPEDGEVLAIQAKAKIECGKKEEGLKLYKEAIYKTRNGLIWKKIENETGISRIDIERDIIENIGRKDVSKQEVQLNLLKEMDKICSENGLKYILTGNTALNAYLNHTIKNNNRMISVAMTQGDLDKFCEVVENQNNNYYVEGNFNNPKFIPFYVSYGDKTTSNFNIVRYNPDRRNGIDIRIYPIRKYLNFDGTEIQNWTPMLSKEEKFRKLLNMKVESPKLWYLKIGKNFLNNIYKFIGGSNRYYNKVKKNTFINKWEDIQNYYKVRIRKNNINTKYLKETCKIKVDDINLSIPKDIESFLTEIYGEEFNEINIIPKSESKLVLQSVNLGYEEFINKNKDLLKESRILYEEIILKRLKVRKDRKVVGNVWRLYKMTEKQIEFEDYFKKNMDYLESKNLDDVEEFEEVKNKIEPVILALKQYSEYGMTFSINPEVDSFIKKVLLKQNETKLVKKIAKLKQQKYFVE